MSAGQRRRVHSGHDVEQHGTVRPPIGAPTANPVVRAAAKASASPCSSGSSSAGTGSGRTSPDAGRGGATPDRREVGNVLDEPRRHGPPHAITAPASTGLRWWRRSRATSTSGAGRQPLVAATASHSGSSTGQSVTIARQRATAAEAAADGGRAEAGSNGGRGGNGVAPHRRATTVAATAASRRPCGVGPEGVGDRVGEQAGRQRRRVAPVRAEQPDRDELVPRLGER